MTGITAYVIARYPHATMLVGRHWFTEVPAWTFTTVVACIAAYFGLDRWYRIDEDESEPQSAGRSR
ncbi:MAG: hypothetical protein JWM87_4224 [Candidatus Eremiobacteraeota bacterium]|nr:hypothetical protein [Candidatus Eremiobacteraeota bacterium]